MKEPSATPYQSNVPITVNIPPPPSALDDFPQTTAPSTAQFIGSMIPSYDEVMSSTSIPFEPVVGDIKMTLDDLKTTTMRYFANLYKSEGNTIDKRLDYIQQYHYPSVFPISGLEKPFQPLPTEKKLISDTITNAPSVETKAVKAYSDMHKTKQLHASEVLGKQSHHRHPDTRHSTGLDLVPPPTRYPAGFDRFIPGGHVETFLGSNNGANFFGLLSGSQSNDQTIPGENIMGRSLKQTPKEQLQSGEPSQGIGDVIWDIKQQADAATRRLAGVSDILSEETDDPTLQAFGYLNYPNIKRRPYFGTQKEMGQHMIQLYGDLYSQTQFNERRIRSLRHGLKVLQMNTLAPMSKIRNDPRLGY